MSTIKQGILGPFSGKVGSVIGATWNGIAYMRGIATSVTNPRTPAQLAQRAKFATVINFLRPLSAFLRIGFKNYAIQMSGFNAAMSYNLNHAIQGIYPDYDIDYSKALLTRGSLPAALNPSATSTVAGTINFTWDDNSTETNASEDDKVIVVVYNPLKSQAVTITDGNPRTLGNDSITIPDSFSGDEVQCFIAFQNANQSVLSNSLYVGSVICV
ncbi:MAG TPA: DUF6266 family protein [Prolixibacteraceae bacterium]|nr:DUF6266 family protein [Prolixibacteraceae bacterium]